MLPKLHIDYLTAVLEYDDQATLQHFLDQVGEYSGAATVLDWRKPLYRGQYWEASGQNALGVLVAAKRGNGAEGKLWISIPGKPLSAMHWERQRELIQWLWARDARFTRIDIAMDLPYEAHTREELRAAIDDHNYTGARNHRCNDSRKGKSKGYCYYVGAAGGLAQMVIYDKGEESGHEIEGHRWELRARDERAAATVGYLMQEGRGDQDSWVQAMGALVVGHMDWRAKYMASRTARAPRLSWWERIVKLVGRAARPAVPREQITADRTITWMKRQVMTSMAMLTAAVKPRDIGKLVAWLRADVPRAFTTNKQATIARWHEEIYSMRLLPAAGIALDAPGFLIRAAA